MLFVALNIRRLFRKQLNCPYSSTCSLRPKPFDDTGSTVQNRDTVAWLRCESYEVKFTKQKVKLVMTSSTSLINN